MFNRGIWPEMGPPIPSGRKSAHLRDPWNLTSTDGGQVPHVMEELIDDGTGPGVQALATNSQVKLDPAGIKLELQWGFQGGEVQLFSVDLVPSERAEEYAFKLEEQKCKTYLESPFI